MTKKKMVLHVEDMPDTRDIVKIILEKEGFLVYGSEDAEKALAALHKIEPDLLLVDIMLPNMSGWEFVQAARERLGKKTPAVVMLSALEVTPEHKRKLGKMGINDYVTKPFTVDALLHAVSRAMGSKK